MSRIKKGNGQVSCEVCGNHCDQCFEVRLGKERHVFDSFECAMQALAPKCAHCGRQIIGHGIQMENLLYCSDPCANSDHVQDHEARIFMNERAHF